MKAFIAVLFLVPTLSFAQMLNVIPLKPNILELTKFRTVYDQLEIRHIKDQPRQNLRTYSDENSIREFYKKLLESDLTKFYCDGDFTMAFDQMGTPYLNIKSIKLCVNEEGSIVAHSIGISKLAQKDIVASKKIIDDARKPLVANPVVNDSSKDKAKEKEEVEKAGVFSPLLSKSISK